MSEYCRLCAKLKPIPDLVNLSSVDNLHEKINIKLLKLNIVIDLQLNLPKSFCFGCLESLERAFEFVTEVQKSQEVLKTLILDPEEMVPDRDSFDTEEKDFITIEVNNIKYPTSIDNDTKVKLPRIKIEMDLCTSKTEKKVRKKKCDIPTEPGTSSSWKDVIWKCIYCETVYASLKDLKSHSIEEHGCCNPYICSECPTKRYSLNLFIKHIREHRPHLLKTCYECNKTFTSTQRLNAHVRTKHRSSEHVCNGCNESFTTLEELNNHVDTFYSKNSSTKVAKARPNFLQQTISNWEMYNWKCTLCEQQYPNLNELTSHSIQTHSRCNPYQCLECPRKPFKLIVFIKHVQQQHYKSLNRSCYKCFQTVDTLTQLHKHHKSHISEYTCEGCHTTFPNAEEMNQHKDAYFKNTVMLPRPEGYEKMYSELQCLVCKKVFKDSSILHTHLWRHLDRPKEYTCDECGQNFVHKTHFLTHKLKHGIGTYKCEICDKMFTTIVYLRKHVTRVHSETTCVCNVCKKSFRNKEYLKRHFATHLDELPFSCDICHKAFKRKEFLNIHMRGHTGTKNYSCEICERDFQNWSNYNKHMVRKHNMDMSKTKRDQTRWENQGDKQLKWKKELLNPGLKRKRKKEDAEKQILLEVPK